MEKLVICGAHCDFLNNSKFLEETLDVITLSLELFFNTAR